MEGELVCTEPYMELTIGAKTPGSVPYSMGNAEIKVYLKKDDNFDKALDDAKQKLEEALSVALLVGSEKNN